MTEIAGAEMLAYMILEVTYRRDADYGHSLAWIALELKDAAGLTMTEDYLELECAQCGEPAYVDAETRTAHHKSGDEEDEDAIGCDADADHTPTFADDAYPSRKWAGTITRAEWDALSSAWSLDPEESTPNGGMLTEYGMLPALAFNFHGDQWNMGGLTPIEFADLCINVPAAWMTDEESQP